MALCWIKIRNTWAPGWLSEEHMTFDLGVMSLSPAQNVDITKKKKKKKVNLNVNLPEKFSFRG